MVNVPNTPIIVVAACVGGVVVLALGWIAIVILSRPRNSPQPLDAIRHDGAGNLSNDSSSWSQLARMWRSSQLQYSRRSSSFHDRGDQCAQIEQQPHSNEDPKAQVVANTEQESLPKRLSWPSPTYSKRKVASRTSYLALEPINERGPTDSTQSDIVTKPGVNDDIPLRDLCGSSQERENRHPSIRNGSSVSTLKRSMSLQAHPGKAPSQPVPSPSKHNTRVSKTQSLRRPTDRALARHSMDSVASVNSSILNGPLSASSRTELPDGSHPPGQQEDSQTFLVTVHKGGQWEWSLIPSDETLSSSLGQFSFHSHGAGSNLRRLSIEPNQEPRLTRSKSSALSMSLLTDALTPARTLSRAGQAQNSDSRLLRYRAALSSTKHSGRASKIPVASDGLKSYGDDYVRRALTESYGNSNQRAPDHKRLSFTQNKTSSWGDQRSSQTSSSLEFQVRHSMKSQEWPPRTSSQAQTEFQEIIETANEGDKKNEHPRSLSPHRSSPGIDPPKAPRPPSISIFDPEIRLSKSPMSTPQKQMQLFKSANTDENSPFRIYGHSLETPTLKPGLRRSQVDRLRNSQKYPPACLLPPAYSISLVCSAEPDTSSDQSDHTPEVPARSHRRALPRTPGQEALDRQSIISRTRRSSPASRSSFSARRRPGMSPLRHVQKASPTPPPRSRETSARMAGGSSNPGGSLPRLQRSGDAQKNMSSPSFVWDTDDDIF